MIKANGSVANIRLFIGNIPKTKSKDEIRDELVKVVGESLSMAWICAMELLLFVQRV